MSGIPELESTRLSGEYNRELRRPEGPASFNMRRLAKEALRIFEQTGDFNAGIIAASCLFFIKKFDLSKELFLRMQANVTTHLDNMYALDLAVRYAHLLVETADFKEAWRVLKPFKSRLHHATYLSGSWVLLACYEGDPDFMPFLNEQYIEQSQHMGDGTPIFAAMLLYHLYSVDPKAWHNVYEYAQRCALGYGYESLSAENLEEFLSEIRAELTAYKEGQPYCPFDDELDEIKQILHMFLSIPEDEIYFEHQVNWLNNTYTAAVTREYDGNGFSAVVHYDSGVIFTEGHDMNALTEMIQEALSASLSEDAA